METSFLTKQWKIHLLSFYIVLQLATISPNPKPLEALLLSPEYVH